ncbi:ABC transporter permease [Lentzea sp. BCCO 10_0798]|uniref:ABC transporter permease n=1 Tax=Lentzea kristufekii TaxID=3095430 RepID=A0ABU4TVW3_9PSEU|nr:ABC transporter permease [Lentzea sp. BCCO 10_0798]MDX8052391.1 ABC transporter permease [Lentzea sp. BCCO 10_0798]
MTWLIWRQHRTEVCVLGLLVGMFGIALLVLGTQAHDLFPGGPARCAGEPGGNEACTASFRRLDEEYGFVENLLAAFYLVPVVIGAFLGAPLLARELEDGTWQLAWTQAVPRMRWLTAKLVALAGVTVALTGTFTAVLTWFRQPFDAWEGRFQYDAFDLEGLVPVAYALFAFGVATAAGAVLRRSLPAFGVAFGAFLAARMSVALLARPAYATPLTTTEPVPVGGSKDQAGHRPVSSSGDWVIEHGYADATGRRLSSTEYYELEGAADRAGTNLNQFLHARGVQQFGVYQFTERLADTFRDVTDRVFLIVHAAADPRRYVQFAGEPDRLDAEAPAKDVVADADEFQLRRFEWVEPDVAQPNWTSSLRRPASTDEFAQLARRCVAALREAYGIVSPDELRYRAWCEPAGAEATAVQLPGLGLG